MTTNRCLHRCAIFYASPFNTPVFCSASVSAFRAGRSVFPAVVCTGQTLAQFLKASRAIETYTSINRHYQARNPSGFFTAQK